MARVPPERSRVPARYRWKTEHLYRSDRAWERDRCRLVAALPAIRACSGGLRSAAAVLSCLQQVLAAERKLGRLASYAARKNDEDTRVPAYQAMREVLDKAATAFEEATAFLEPELLALGDRRLRALARDPRFADLDRYLLELLRQRPHVLSVAEEQLLASTSLFKDTGNDTYEVLSAADLTFPTIRDERGRAVQLTQPLFTRFRSSPDRRVRREAFRRFFETFGAFRNTFAALLSAQINSNIVYARARHHETALAAALHDDEIPQAAYHAMIAAVRRHLPKLHRYLTLRRRTLGLRRLAYHDLYAPLVPRVTLRFPYASACAQLPRALAPLGAEYTAALARALQPASGWVDPLPTRGKRSGAYMDGDAYDVHPYVLGNYVGDYDSLSMLAHEMGHAMHSYFTNRTQPYAKADYATFVAEVASTVNEELLAAHLAKTLRGDRRRFVLFEQLEGFRQTFFRQAMFAELELSLYRIAEADGALTAERITSLYLELLREYYGAADGLVVIDDHYGVEWAWIPHFYYQYYVFQYVTGVTAATALARRIREQGAAARDAYLEHLLRAGCSDAPLQLLRRAGVDLTTTEPYDRAAAAFEQTLDEAEAALRGRRR